MDWENESYVRLYIRDTTTWLRLGWNGQCVLAQILRKMDMSGVMDIGELEPWEAAVVHCRAPEDAARDGMKACLAHGVFAHNDTYLVAPNFREAQEAVKSDRLRQKESRERRRLDAMSQNVTDQSQNVTKCHAGSRAVTLGHAPSLSAVQCSAVQDSAVPSDARASGPTSAEIAVGLYLAASGNTDVGDVSPSWTPAQQSAALTMVAWARRNTPDPTGWRATLEAELNCLKRDAWLASKTLHLWAKALGTGKKQQHTGSRKADNSVDFETKAAP